MQCPACGADNVATAKFCLECGRPQQSACAGCGTLLPAQAKFCGECGTPVAAATAAAAVPPPRAPVAERRVCSVLFCDLVGFTPLSETRDPEEVRELLSRYFDVARTIIQRYGGVVEKFIGDAVMAVWGAPVAADGDAERSVRAALDVVDAVAELGREAGIAGLAARAGVVTGEVAVTVGATGEGMVAGDAVNTAARVQSAATSGSVLVDDGTWRVARGAVAFTDAGEHDLKGKTEAMRLWRAERVLSGVGGAQRVDGLEAPLVGRDAEMRLIKELFHACVDRRQARLVSITGPAGVGKSRLGWEFFKYIDGLADLVRWHRGRCLSYGEGVAFWALAEMVRQRLGIAEDDLTPATAAKLTEGLATWVPDETTRDYVAPRVARLLGVDDDGTVLGREELFAGWRMFFETMAATKPVVLLVEDVQYADAGLLDFLEHLLDWARDVPIFVITLARPELADRRPGWGIGRRNSTALALEPLDDASMRAMLDGLVPGMPEAAVSAIARQAQGVPLYAVETVRMLVDRDAVQPVEGIYRLVGDVGELTVPDTLQSLLAARLDALDPDARGLVADAAVLGGSFPADALVAVSALPAEQVRRLLPDLVRREVLEVRADPLSPDKGQYAFVQTMFRHVAYDTLSRRERKARHLLVADHLGTAFADGGEEVSEVIASHLLDALAAVPDDADVPVLRDRAVNALVRSGERADRTGARATAAHAYARAAQLEEQAGSRESDESAAELYERASVSASTANDHDEAAVYDEAAAVLYDRHGAARSAARARASVGMSLRRRGRLEEARTTLREALDVLKDEIDPDTISAMEQLALVQLLSRGPDAELLAREALRLAQEIRLSDKDAGGLLLTVGMCALHANQWREAVALMREALMLARGSHDPALSEGVVGLNLADVLVITDPPAAVEVARAAVADARRLGNRYLLPTAIGNLVQALLLTGDWDEAEHELPPDPPDGDWMDLASCYIVVLFRALRGHVAGLDDRVAVLETATDSEDEQVRGSMRMALAVLARGRRDDVGALAHARAALEAAAASNCSHEIVRWAWSVAADAAFDLADLGAVAELLDWLGQFPDGYLADVQVAERARVRAKLLAARGDAGADAAIGSAVAEQRRLGSPYHLALGLLDQAEHLAAAGDRPGAAVAAAEAGEIGGRLGCLPVQRRATAILGDRVPIVATDPAPAALVD